MGISFSTSLIEGFGDRHFTEKNKKEKSEEERESGRKIEVSLLRQWRLGFSIDRPYRNLPPVPSLHLSPRPQNPNSKHFNSISAIFNSGSESCDGRAGKILRQFQFDAGEFFYSCWPFGCQEIVGKEVKTWNLVTYWGWSCCCEIWSFGYLSLKFIGNQRVWNIQLGDIFLKRSQDLLLRSCLQFGRTHLVFPW